MVRMTHTVCLFLMIFFFVGVPCGAESLPHSFAQGKRVGVVSLFPSPSGLFFNHRAKLVGRIFGDTRSVFPDTTVVFHQDVNAEITQYVVHALEKKFLKTTFFSLPGLSAESHLTGYLIEGIWGPETNSVQVKGLAHFFEKYRLDGIVAVVPVTYHLKATGEEGTGLNLTFSRHLMGKKNKQFFSAAYAVLFFSKESTQNNGKIYSSLKQIFEKQDIAPPLKHVKTTKGTKLFYGTPHVELFYRMLKEHFMPYLTYQMVAYLENPALEKDIFKKPVVPFSYQLPH